jgi:protein-disulfide isomerase/uncharacterized membrane protein
MKCKTITFLFGTVLLLVAIGASVALAGTKLGLFTFIPGCGEGSGCDLVTNGPWGTVPGLNIPVSFVGLAWFCALLAGWIMGGINSKKYRYSVFVGVLASVGFVVLMIYLSSFCKWCALAHVCNILFWVLCLWGCGRSGCDGGLCEQTASRGAGVLWICFIGFLVVFCVIGAIVTSKNKQKSEDNIAKIASGDVNESTLELLEGGHRIGSPDAPIQVVMFTDYQCPDCKRIEGQLAAIMKTRSDISVVVKHFPLNFECNDQIGTFKLHGNACWAARAAEAAAIVGGQEAWETMHTWLFSQEGRFTDKTFAASLTSLGFNAQEIINVMMGDATLQTVKENARDGKLLGVYFTPMVFINGVEYLWYYGGGKSLQAAIAEVSEKLAAGDISIAAPPSASKKLVEDWRRGAVRNVPGSEDLSWLGEGPVEFVVWSDYQAGLSKVLDEEIKRFITEENNDIRYTFRHFPVDESCNGGVANMPTKYTGSCMLAKLVVAARALGGDEARWLMHNWIMKQEGDGPSSVDITEATEYAKSITGVDDDILASVIGGIDVNNIMRMDILAKNNVWRKSIPVLMVNNRLVPRWRSDDVSAHELFEQIIQSAKSESVDNSSR